MSDTPGIEPYPEYLARKGDPAKRETTIITESYPDYLARKAAEADAPEPEPEGKKAKGVEDKAVKAEAAEGK